MSSKEILKGTAGFIWKKMGVGFLSMLILVVPAGILFGIGCIFNIGIAFLLGLIGFVIGIRLQTMFNKYFGYMVKASHVAVITDVMENGVIPDNQYEYGKSIVKQNFAEANVYFVIDTLVSKAVRQIQSKMSGVADFIGNIIPMGEAFVNQFIKSMLDYIDECCLGYTFYRDDEDNKFKSSCDGIVLYFQNWKNLLKTSLKVSLLAVVFNALIFVVVSLIFGLIFRLFMEGSVAFFVAILIGMIVSGVIKSAVIDTYVYIDIMRSFFIYATEQEPNVDLYDTFCKVSKAFKELFTKSDIEASDDEDIISVDDVSTPHYKF